MRECQFRTTTLRVAKASVDVERGKRRSKKKKNSAQIVTAILMNGTVTPFLESARKYVKLVCDGLISRSLWMSHLVKRLTSSNYPLFFSLLKERAGCCYSCLLSGFSVRGWVAENCGESTFRNTWI